MKTPLSYFLYKKKDMKFVAFSHIQIEDIGTEVSAEQSLVLDIPYIFSEYKDNGCIALTDGMANSFDENKLTLSLVYLNKTRTGNSIQTWVYKDEVDMFFYFSQRDINEPKGYVYRCQEDVISKMEGGLKLASTINI